MVGRRLAAVLWELPQSSIGVIALVAHGALGNVVAVDFSDGRLVVELRGTGAISLGQLVFYSTRDNAFVPVGAENREHELGHAIQSRRLGPLYLPLVGVPSLLRVAYAVAWKATTGRRWPRYYDGWPEDSADRLGGANPALRPRP